MTPSLKESCSRGKNIETDQDVPCYFFLARQLCGCPLFLCPSGLVKSRPVAEAMSDPQKLMYHRKLEGEQNRLGVQGHRATRTFPVSWSAPDGGFVTLACNLAFFSEVDGRARRSRTLAVNQEHTVFSHGLSREVGMVYDVPQGRTMAESLMLQVFLQREGSADIAASRFGSRLFGLKIQIHPLATGGIYVTDKMFQICVLS